MTIKIKRKFGTVICWGQIEEGATIIVDYVEKNQPATDDLLQTGLWFYNPEVHGEPKGTGWNTFSKIATWLYKDKGIKPVQISTDY